MIMKILLRFENYKIEECRLNFQEEQILAILRKSLSFSLAHYFAPALHVFVGTVIRYVMSWSLDVIV